ncbi:hypothetical protein [Motilibacter peucedani]|uniref:hypothetical protein n=1 Tax=Motilibacter peucedani TaxID=598650 RepID=UPI0015FF681E|nr:hypothetical protein [Motilibacter peucedani]
MAIAAGTAGVVLSAGLVTVVTGTTAAAVQCLPSSVSITGTVPPSAALTPAQAANATTIVSAVVDRRMPSRAAVIAVATAMQESRLLNLASEAVPESLTYPHDDVAPGDHDSVGLFQQRPSQGWGAVQQLMTPSFAAGAFLDALEQVQGWEAMPLTQAAQAVQRSGAPDAYAQWEQQAQSIVNGLLGRPDDPGTGDQTVGDAPGLYVEGDGLLAALAGATPVTFNSGLVTSSVQRGRTTAEGIADLTAHRTTLPGSLLVSLGAADHLTSETASTYRTQVRSVLALAHDGHTVYWLTDPGADVANGVLREEATADNDLQLVDLDYAVQAHPEWMTGTALNDAGVTGATKLLKNALGTNTDDDPTDPTNVDSGSGCSDGLGGYSSVPVADCTFTLARANPRSCQDAIRWALAQQDGPAQWYRKCLNFVARSYGYAHSGVGAPYTAREFWLESTHQHPLDPNPPAGALVFWNGGSAGHVALSAGNGLVISNDIRGHGTIALVPLSEITERWHDPYLGWADPYFPAAA